MRGGKGKGKRPGEAPIRLSGYVTDWEFIASFNSLTGKVAFLRTVSGDPITIGRARESGTYGTFAFSKCI